MNETYRTDDVFQASILLSLGNKMREMDTSTRRVSFVFERTNSLENDLRMIISREVLVDPFILKSNQDYLYNSVRTLTSDY